VKLTRLVSPQGRVVAADGSFRNRCISSAWVSDAGGWAVRVRSVERKMPTKHASNLAEIFALYLAVIHHSVESAPIELQSDSTVALEWMQRWIDGDYTVPSFDNFGFFDRSKAVRVNVRAARAEVKLTWVPGHVGHSLNEAADAVARLGSRAVVDGLSSADIIERGTGIARAFTSGW
jgi:ribonuclease HI